MNLNKKAKVQSFTKKNGKILDLQNVKFILSESEEYQIVTELIKRSSQNKEIKRILIIGDNLIYLYSQLKNIFPKAQFYITNKSKDLLDFFKKRYSNQKNYSTYILDVFKGVSLNDFIYNNSRFDLVIANKIYSKVKKKKRYYSIRFLYKFYLDQEGLLLLINNISNSKKVKLNPLDPIKPTIKKIFPIKNEKYLLQFISYSKNNSN